MSLCNHTVYYTERPNDAIVQILYLSNIYSTNLNLHIHQLHILHFELYYKMPEQLHRSHFLMYYYPPYQNKPGNSTCAHLLILIHAVLHLKPYLYFEHMNKYKPHTEFLNVHIHLHFSSTVCHLDYRNYPHSHTE